MGLFEMPSTKYASTCVCGHRVPAGTRVMYDRDLKPAIRSCPACVAPAAAPALEPRSGAIALRVKVYRVRSEDPDGSWSAIVATLDPDQPVDGMPVEHAKNFSVSGALGKVLAGDFIEAYGNWENHPKYGWQFVAIRAAKIVGSTLQALSSFLCRLPHLGRTRALAIVQHFVTREAILEAVQNGEALTVIKGLTMERAMAIRDAYLEAGNLREAAIYLAGLQIGEELTAKIIDEWGADARAMLEENPYNMMVLNGVGFLKADEIAIGRLGMHPHDARRAAAAVLYLLQEEEYEGHTWSDIRDMVGYEPVAL